MAGGEARLGAARRPGGGACWGGVEPLLFSKIGKFPLPSLYLPPQVPPIHPLPVVADAGRRARSHRRAFALAVPLPGAPQTPAWLPSLFPSLCSNVSPTEMPFSVFPPDKR